MVESEPTQPAGRVRIWDKNWNCLIDEREQPGDTPSDVVQRAVGRLSRSH